MTMTYKRMMALVSVLGLATQLSCSRGSQVAAELEFDAAGKLVAFSDPDGKKTSFRYDTQGLLVEALSPDGSAKYGYDAHGNRIWVRDDAGSTEYYYDAFDKLSAAIWNRGPRRLIAYQYDHVGLPSRISVFNLQRLERDARFSAQVAWLRPANQPSAPRWHEREQRVLDLAEQLRAAAGGNAPWLENDISYVRNLQGDLQEIQSEDGTVRFDRSADGRRVERILPNGVHSIFEYSPNGRLSRLRHIDSLGREIASFSYNYDPVGRLQNLAGGEAEQVESRDYAWDSRGRLREMDVSDGDKFLYKYDDKGKYLAVTSRGKTVTVFFDELGRISKAQGIAFGVTPQGTLSAWAADHATTEIRYNHQSLPVEVRTRDLILRYVWDSEGNLVSRTLRGKTVHFVPAAGTGVRQPLMELGEDGAPKLKHLVGESVLGRLGAGTAEYYLEGASGDFSYIVDQTGCPCGRAALSSADSRTRAALWSAPRSGVALVSASFNPSHFRAGRITANLLLAQCVGTPMGYDANTEWWNALWASVKAFPFEVREDMDLLNRRAALNWSQPDLLSKVVGWSESFAFVGWGDVMLADQEIGEAGRSYRLNPTKENLLALQRTEWNTLKENAKVAPLPIPTTLEKAITNLASDFIKPLLTSKLATSYARLIYQDVKSNLDSLITGRGLQALNKEVSVAAPLMAKNFVEPAWENAEAVRDAIEQARDATLKLLAGNQKKQGNCLGTSCAESGSLMSKKGPPEQKPAKQLAGRPAPVPQFATEKELPLLADQDSKKKKPDLNCFGPGCGGDWPPPPPLPAGGPGRGGPRSRGSDSSSKQLGGIELSNTASVLGDLGYVYGAVYDPPSGSIVLLSDNSDAAVSGVKAEDMAVALRLAYSESPEEAAFSLDPADPKHPTGPWLQKVYYPDKVLVGTNFGRAMFEADWLLKQYSFGVVAEEGKPQAIRTSAVPSYKSVAALSLASEYGANRPATMSRFWIVSREMRIRRDGSAIVFDKAAMGVKTRRQVLDPNSKTGLSDDDRIKDPIDEEFARRFTEHFDELAVESPEFERVRELAKAVAIAKWLRQNNVPVDLAGMNLDKIGLQTDDPESRKLIPALSTTFEQVRKKAIHDGNREGVETLTRQLFLFGGVDLKSSPEYVRDSRVGELQRAVQEELNRRDEPRFEVSYGGQNFTANVLPLTHEALVRRANAKYFVRDGDTYRVDSQGKVVGMVDTLGNRAHYFDPMRGPAGGVEITGNGGWYAVAQPLKRGASLRVTTARGNEFDVIYDSEGAVERITVDGKTWAEYQKQGTGRSVRFNQGSYTEVVTFDSAGKPTSYGLERSTGSGKKKTESAKMEYSADGLLTRLSGNDINDIRWQYDNARRLRRVASSDGTAVTVSYDDEAARTTVERTATTSGEPPDRVLGKLTFENNLLAHSEFPQMGRVDYQYEDQRIVSIKAERSGETCFAYDRSGRPKSVTLPSRVRLQYKYLEMDNHGSAPAKGFKVQVLGP